MGAHTRRVTGFRPMRCSSVAKTSTFLPGCFAASSATASARFMEWPAPPSGVVGSPEAQLEGRIMKVSVLGIDLGKNVCSIVGLDASGAVVLRRRAKRETLIGLVAKLPPCIVAMEACCGAHHLGRLFARHGKNTWSSELSASIRICSRWQRMCSNSGISCLRLEDGRASKSRLRGQFDGALIREPPRLDTRQQPYGIPRRRAVEGPPGVAIGPWLTSYFLRPGIFFAIGTWASM